MHEFLTEKLVFGKPHPPWKEIWDAADRRTHLRHYRGRVHDGTTGKTYPNAAEYIKATQDDDDFPIPFAVGRDGLPDYDHALEA